MPCADRFEIASDASGAVAADMLEITSSDDDGPRCNAVAEGVRGGIAAFWEPAAAAAESDEVEALIEDDGYSEECFVVGTPQGTSTLPGRAGARPPQRG